MATIEKSDSPEEPQVPQSKRPGRGISTWALTMSLLVGIYFGIVLTKSEVVRWQRIHDMFLLKEPNMYLIIGVGIVVAMILMALIKKWGVKTIEGVPIVYRPKPFQKGIVIGGTVFGAGWAIAGACPGPIYAQLGGGEPMALFTLAGALIGTYVYAKMIPILPR